MSRSVCIVIPVFNKWELTAPCLESLRRHTDPDLCEVVVADNASTDATPDQCPALGRELFGKAFHYLAFETNRNFGPACNAGARASESPVVLFLNNDTLLTEGWLDALLPVVRQEDVGAAGPLLLYPAMGRLTDLVEHAGLAFEPRYYPNHVFEFFHRDHPAVRARRNWQALTGAALCLRREVFEAVGGFHEAYANGGEDVDLTLHIRQLGLELACVHQSVVYHLKGQTPGRYESDAHNAAILKGRCLGFIGPDLVHHLRTAGFDLRLNAMLQVCMAVPQRRLRFLERELVRARTVDDLCALIRKEPVFYPAYAALADQELAQGNDEAAVAALYLRFRVGKDDVHLLELIDLAERTGHEAMAAWARGLLASHTDEKFQEMRATAQEMVRLYEGFADAGVAPLYRQWLERADEIRARWFSSARP